MSTLQAKFLRLRLFAEGVELPIISASIQLSVNAVAVASLQVVPLDSLKYLKPKTMIHVFYFDWTNEEDITDPNDYSRYNLIFSGETSGISYMKSSLGRSAVIQCADFTNTWTKAYQYMITYGPDGNFLTPSASNYAAGTNKFDNIIDGHLGVLGRYLNSQPKSPGFRNIKGLLGGILTLIEQFGGVVGHQKGVLDTFTVAELKNKTMQQIAAEDNDNTAQKIFDAKEFYEWLEIGLANMGELCTLWDMIKLLFQYIYYESAPVCAPYYVPGTPSDKFQDSEKINKILEEVLVSLYYTNDFDNLKLRSINAVKNLQLINSYQALSTKQLNSIEKAVSSLNKLVEETSFSKTAQELLASAKNNVNAAITKLDKIEAKKIEVERLNTVVMKPECYFVAAPRCSVLFPEHNTQFTWNRNTDQEPTRLRLQSGMVFNIDEEKLFADFSYAPSGKEIAAIAKEQDLQGRRSAVLPWEKFSGIIPKFEYIQDINYVANKAQKDLQKNIQGLAKSYKQKAANFNFYKYRFMARTMSGSCRFNPYLVVGFPLVVIDKPFLVDREKLIDIALQNNTTIDKISTQDIVDNIKNFAEALKAPDQYIGYANTITHLIGQDGATTSFSCTHARSHRLNGDDFLQIYKNAASEGKGTVVTKTLLDADVLVKKGDRKSLQLLIDLTPQTVVTTTVTQATATNTNSILDLTLDEATTQLNEVKPRPKLSISGYDVIAPNFRQPPLVEVGEYIAETQITELNGASIKTPVKYGKLSIGKKGPNGNISTIRVLNDLIKKIEIEGKSYYVWSSILLYEEQLNAKILASIPIEEVLRPTWFSSNYSNLKIGEQIYDKFFGCGSVVDELVYKNAQGLSIQGGGKNRFDTLDKLTKSQDLVGDIENLSQTNLTQIPSMESAIDVLAFQYGEVIKQGLDVNRFVDDYTKRPIATMVDVLGSEDLQLTPVGNDLKVVSGTLGFHSVAVSGYGDLIGLLSDPSLPLANRVEKSTLPKGIDPRPERKAAVQKYLEELQVTSLEVIGLQG